MQTDYGYILQKLKREKEELELAEREDMAEESREQKVSVRRVGSM